MGGLVPHMGEGGGAGALCVRAGVLHERAGKGLREGPDCRGAEASARVVRSVSQHEKHWVTQILPAEVIT